VASFAVASGIVTAVGGRTAHAALVARQLNKPCIVGYSEPTVDVASHCAWFPRIKVNEGDWLSIDGNAGAIYLARGKVVLDKPEAELSEIEPWRKEATRPNLV